MRKSILTQQQHVQHDQLIINYKQQEVTIIDSFQPVWNQVWSKFQNDICSYIIPSIIDSIQQNSMASQDNHKFNNHFGKSAKHTFSFAYSTRQLKRVILMHSNIDVFTQIRKQITRIFYKIANVFVVKSMKINPDNFFEAIIYGYHNIQPKFTVLIGCLNLVLNKFITKKGLEEQLYSIINKQLINHHEYENYVSSCMACVQSLRNCCLQIKVVNVDQTNIKSGLNNKMIQELKLLNGLKIFPYLQYLQRSKKYYAQLLQKIPKNIWMFPAMYQLVKVQKMLQNIIVPDEEQLQKAKRILKDDHWRAIEQDGLVKVLCRQVLEEIYDDMLEYVDYLVQFQTAIIGQDARHNMQQNDFNLQEKRQLLKFLWQLTKILQKNQNIEKEKSIRNLKYSSTSMDQRIYQFIPPSEKLLNRIVVIISDVKKFINPELSMEGNKTRGNQIYKIIQFRDHIFSTVAQCFDNNSKYLNLICSKIEESISSEEQIFNQKLCDIILSPYYRFPGLDKNKQQITSQQFEMLDQMDQKNRNLNNKYSQQLFKIASSKQQFIRKFQQQFSNYIFTGNQGQINLGEQEQFIRNIQKQSGSHQSRNIERMLYDIWRDGKMIYYVYGITVCRILSQDWPKFQQSKFKLADQLHEIRADAQLQFLSKRQNDKKKLKWIQQCGKITLSICGTQSSFSQLQASIIMLLNRSYRPLKGHQFKQILQYTEDDMEIILTELVLNKIILFNSDAGNYELNTQNKTPYHLIRTQKIETKVQKRVVQKDYTHVIQAIIARILKRRKSVQKTDLFKLVSNQIKLESHHLTVEEINNSLERLRIKNVINIQKTRGIIKYLQ